ncbi:DNA adenine methylase [Bordetella bronchialis]|uniref:site-specific DNA-methyltransferase (adenine-specific) n=1 Tax=Bordetella bronchialis TaxID=463025 RepID=A0A193FSN6_9BORD|nr:DNA adenine methylase [Bordetella bronchialis]ANN70640.1 DNA methyltransferase [Bordetella bronchialis]
MPVNNTPLRYPGGKSQLAPFVVELMRANGLLGGVYVEPFAGGAGIAWKLLFDGYTSEVWINDIDPAIHAFWYCVLHRTEELCKKIESTEVTIDEWHRQRHLQASARPQSLALGFSTFFLNRTNRSGILKAGVIGGLAQAGDWKLDCRFKKEDLIEKIRRIALYKEQITLTRQDASTYLSSTVKTLPRHALINIDPPYYRKGPELYCSFYEHADHKRLAQTIRKLRRPWMLTYDDAPEIRALYRGLPATTKELTYYAQVKRTGIELLVLNPNLRAPGAIALLAA